MAKVKEVKKSSKSLKSVKKTEVKPDVNKPILLDEMEALSLENKLLKLEMLQLKQQKLQADYQEFMKSYQQDINDTNALVNTLVERYNIPDGFVFDATVKGFVFKPNKN